MIVAKMKETPHHAMNVVLHGTKNVGINQTYLRFVNDAFISGCDAIIEAVTRIKTVLKSVFYLGHLARLATS